MRSGGRLWMVTLRGREPEGYEELPMYFRTRLEARHWAEDRNADQSSDYWGWRDDDELVAGPAPDDVLASDIAWDDEP